jgi:hypothetical protein
VVAAEVLVATRVQAAQVGLQVQAIQQLVVVVVVAVPIIQLMLVVVVAVLDYLG